MTNKRKLKVLMPEVLPEPRPATAPGGPRDRTLKRMQGLLALTAAGTSLAACSRESPDPGAEANRPHATASSSVIAPAVGGDPTGAPPTASNLTSGSAAIPPPSPTPKTPARPPRGYAVVDPMPPPVRCYAMGSGAASARWVDRKTLAVSFPRPADPKVKFESPAPASASTNEALSNPIKKQTVKNGALTVMLDVPAEASVIRMSIRLDCGPDQGLASTGTLYATVSGPGGKPLQSGVTPSVDVAGKVQLDGF